jgi:glycosyltransferase involved in cell wall biosynthesis
VLDECRRLGLESHVKLLGHCDDDELKRLYQRAELFVYAQHSVGAMPKDSAS